jgi:hypothetical protein
MGATFERQMLVGSLQRALIGEVHPQLRQASIDLDVSRRIVKLRFEFDGEPDEEAWNCCSCVATEVIADFPDPWMLEEEYLAAPFPAQLTPLACVGYRRSELGGP